MDKIYSLISKNSLFNFIAASPVTVLPVSFLLLCLFGGLLLYLPCCGSMSFLDALFTSVSGVCVTGLSVQDISTQLNASGQFILLILIQTGALGIMSISSVIFLFPGRKMSVQFEKNARSMFDAESRDEIKASLRLIFKYTFIIEASGALILSAAFAYCGHSISWGLKQGVFLAVSAFSNAGYALISDNLIPYSSNGIILYTVSFLIIAGGIAPVIAIAFPKYLKKEKLPPLAVIVFNTTIILLLLGTFLIFISEYNGILSGMNLWDKISNSWFLSVSARTAGFSSVDMGNLNCISYAALIFLMAAGGSPGGTAGGIKTAAAGVLALTCYNTLCGKKNVIRNREIPKETVFKSVTLVFIYSAAIMTSAAVLIASQMLPDNKLIFEAVSAMGTVGLSMGITSQLDAAGKITIILTMFAGRVLPAMAVYYMNMRKTETDLSYPQAKISLT